MRDRLAEWYTEWSQEQIANHLHTEPTDQMMLRRKDLAAWWHYRSQLPLKKRTVRIIEEWEGWPYRVGQVYVAVSDTRLRISPQGNFSDCGCIQCRLRFNLLYAGYHVIRITHGLFAGWPIPLVTTEPLDDLAISGYERRK